MSEKKRFCVVAYERVCARGVVLCESVSSARCWWSVMEGGGGGDGGGGGGGGGAVVYVALL